MNWRYQLIIGIICCSLAFYCLYLSFLGETFVKQSKKLNEMTGKYEYRYYEFNTGTVYLVPAYTLGIIGLVLVFSGFLYKDD